MSLAAAAVAIEIMAVIVVVVSSVVVVLDFEYSEVSARVFLILNILKLALVDDVFFVLRLFSTFLGCCQFIVFISDNSLGKHLD